MKTKIPPDVVIRVVSYDKGQIAIPSVDWRINNGKLQLSKRFRERVEAGSVVLFYEKGQPSLGSGWMLTAGIMPKTEPDKPVEPKSTEPRRIMRMSSVVTHRIPAKQSA